jgi:hypothetical protein
MRRRFGRSFLLVLVMLALGPVASASAAEPPWCGTPEPDGTAALPDGTHPGDPVGSFPHIPHYAIGCTLEDIAARSHGRMQVKVIGKSALGRDMFGVVINRLSSDSERQSYENWTAIRALALKNPSHAQKVLQRADDVKVPIFVQSGIHGNESEGIDASIDIIEKYATTPDGADPVVDNILSHAVLVFNVIQNPDGHVLNQRANGIGFDLNRDYLTQSQSETKASVTMMKQWLPPEVLDLHGYVNPTLIEATTKPHNPSIEYDLWLKWNQPRIDANEAALNALTPPQQIQRPINDWCPEADLPNGNGLCDGGETPGPDTAEGWDDWGPFYTAMYAQHLGLDSSTVEMCNSVSLCGGRIASRTIQRTVIQSTYEYVVGHRQDMLHDELEIYRRGDVDAPRPACCPPPFSPETNNWMLDYPKAYVIPFGNGQRSDPEANRLVEWALFNDIEVERLEGDYRFNGQTFQEGSYVVWMAQPRRGLADTALSIGVDISPRIQRLYAPPAAWSHGYLWGADTITIPDGAQFSPRTEAIRQPNRLSGGVESGPATAYTLEIDSPTAVRALNDVLAKGAQASLALASFGAGPAGTAVFGTDQATKNALDSVGADRGLTFRRFRSGTLPALDPIERVPRIAVLTGAVNQDVWSLQQLGFSAAPVSTATINTAATDPLANYDVIYNSGSNYPANTAANATGRARLAAFFAGGGGYIGALTTGANFLNTGGQVTGLTPANRGGSGRSGIIYWDNTGGAASVITGAYPARDTAIVDPPTWLTAVPATMSVDGRLPASNFFAAGLWPIAGDALSASAAGAAVIAHGTNTADTARLTVFANNPLYRADPEREWPMVGTAAYWADK